MAYNRELGSLLRRFDTFGKVTSIAALGSLGTSRVSAVADYINCQLNGTQSITNPAVRETLNRLYIESGIVMPAEGLTHYGQEWKLNDSRYAAVALNAMAVSAETGFAVSTFIGRHAHARILPQRPFILDLAHSGLLPLDKPLPVIYEAGLAHDAFYDLREMGLVIPSSELNLFGISEDATPFMTYVFDPLKGISQGSRGTIPTCVGEYTIKELYSSAAANRNSMQQ